MTKHILIGKLLSLDLKIRFLRFDPWPDINTQVFFFYHFKELKRFTLFLSLEMKPIS